MANFNSEEKLKYENPNRKTNATDESPIGNCPSNGSANYLQLNQVKENIEEELKCSVCTEILVKPTVLNCSHLFCEYCITQWKKRQQTCPYCRERIFSQIRVLALDVFIEKAVEVLSPDDNIARAAMIRQRERKILQPRRRLPRDSVMTVNATTGRNPLPRDSVMRVNAITGRNQAHRNRVMRINATSGRNQEHRNRVMRVNSTSGRNQAHRNRVMRVNDTTGSNQAHRNRVMRV